jgi:hypothetical protein
MAQVPPPIHPFEFTHSNARFPLQRHHSSDWRPTAVEKFDAWNASPQAMFPSTPLIGPGHNPNLLPRLEPRHPTHVDGVSANDANLGKRKRTTQLGSVENSTSSVGGYGPISPGEAPMETDTLKPSPPSLSFKRHRNVAYDVWAFAQPLISNEEPPPDQWPMSREQYLTEKPKSPWFGCKLCSQFGYVYTLSICLGSFILIFSCFRDQLGVKRWRVFNNKNPSKSSPTTPFRRHLEEYHASLWVQECARLNIPIKHPPREALDQTPDVPKTEPFTKDGLSRHLVGFVSGDDQVRPLPFMLGDR